MRSDIKKIILISIQYFYLFQRSEIRRLRKKSFSGMHYVGHLNLRKNIIHQWEPGTFADLPNQNVLSIELKLNMFDCVCKNFWWLTQDSQYRLSTQILVDNSCGTPKGLAGDTLAQLNSSYLSTCSKTRSDYEDYDFTQLQNGSNGLLSLPFLLLTGIQLLIGYV